MISINLSSRSLILSSLVPNLLLIPSSESSVTGLIFFSSKISVQSFLWSIYLLNFSFCSCIVFLISNCLFMFSCSSLDFLKMIILISSSLWISISLGSVTGTLLVSFGDVMFLCFFLTLVSLHWCPCIGLYRLALAAEGIHLSPGLGFWMS